MSLLSRDLDSFISERDFEAAKSAIQKASVRIKNKAASPNWEDRLPQLIVPPRTPEDAVGALRYLEDVYATKDWTTLKETLDLLEPALPKKLPEYTSRKLFAAAMIADPSAMSNLYAQIADHLALDPANGDLYLAMGALKLAELSLVDCRFLLELATKCPIYHPLMLPILLEKLNWSESAYNRSLLLIGQIFTRPNAVKQLIDKHPEHKHLSAEMEVSVAEWYPATHLQRLRMAKTWMNTPHMSELMNLDLAFEVYNSSDTSLLALPNTVLQRILEYSEMPASLKLLRTCPLGYLRVTTSPAWVSFAAKIIGVTKEEIGPDPHGTLGECLYVVFCSSFPLLDSLQTCDTSYDIPLIEQRQWASISMSDMYTPCVDHKSMAICFLLQILMNYIRGRLSHTVIQYVVNTTQLHLSLARLTAGATENVTILSMMLLTMLLGCGASDAPKWAQSLRDVGYHNLIACGLSENAEIAAAPLANLIEFHHYIDFPRTTNIFAQADPDTNARYEDPEYLAKRFAGVWHVLWSYPYTWSEGTQNPFYGTFQVDQSTIRLETEQPRVGGDDSDDEDDGNVGVDQRARDPLLEELAEDIVFISMSGTGCIVTDEGKLVKSTFEARVTGFGGSEQVELVLKEAGLEVHGLAFHHGFGGQVLENDIVEPTRKGDAYDYSEQRPVSGGFMLWKSSADDTEQNWIEEEAELKELAAHRIQEAEKEHGEKSEVFLRRRAVLRSLRYRLLHADRCMIALSMPISNFDLSAMHIPELEPRKLPEPLLFDSGPEPAMQREVRRYSHIWFSKRAHFLRLQIARFLVDKSYLLDLQVICGSLQASLEQYLPLDEGGSTPASGNELAEIRALIANWKAISDACLRYTQSSDILALKPHIEKFLDLTQQSYLDYGSEHPANPLQFAHSVHNTLISKLQPGGKNPEFYASSVTSTFAPKQTVLARINDRQALHDGMSSLNKVYEKWMSRLGLCYPAYHYSSSPVSLEFLGRIIAFVILMGMGGSEYDDLQLTVPPSMDELEEEKEETSGGFSTTTTILIGGLIAAAAIGGLVASFFFGRRRKRVQ